VTIDILPDLVLLEIFDFYAYEEKDNSWHNLVHVCRKWRNVVFGSPRRLNLRLFCNARTPVKELLEVWPPLPISVCNDGDNRWGIHNIIAALEYKDRICQLDLYELPGSQLETVLETMQQPFPALSHLILRLQPGGGPVPVIPASFLGGSAPHLQSLWLDYIPFPGLSKLLLSATHMVLLVLSNIPDSGYISPEEMIACLSVLTKLENLAIDFDFPQSHPRSGQTSRHSSPQTFTLLPVLTSLYFGGVKEYLEDLVAQIDAPLLDKLTIGFLRQGFDTNIPQLTKFFDRTPKLKAHDEAHGVLRELRHCRFISI
jgi:F-box-like